MPIPKISCIKGACIRTILPSTVNYTGGLCVPCFKKAVPKSSYSKSFIRALEGEEFVELLEAVTNEGLVQVSDTPCEERLPCNNGECQRTILTATATRTGGVCMPCFQESQTVHAPNSEWSHPKLGEFESDDWRWIQEEYDFISLGKIFPKCNTVLELTIGVNEDDCGELGVDDQLPPPSDEMLDMTIKVLGNLEQLIVDGVEALWNDFHGVGKSSSGMWWHDAVDEVFECEYGPKKPNDCNGLIGLLVPTGVDIEASAHNWNGPAAKITFASEIDEEHGISFLTDGDRIIGLGYSMDPLPFEALCTT